MKIVFFGTPPFIEPVIDVLDKNFDLAGVVRKPMDFNDDELKEFRQFNADIFVVAAYGKILPGELLDIPRLGAINIHPSLLPKYRGPSPVQNAILNGDEKTGLSFIKMDEEVDHGPILEQFEEPILENDTFESLAEKLFKLSADRLPSVIARFSEDQKGKVQDDSKATFTKLITKEAGFIDLKNPPENQKLERMIRAYFPWPGVWTEFGLSNPDKEQIIKLLPDRRIQVEGKNPMNYKDFKNGYTKGEEFLGKLKLNQA